MRNMQVLVQTRDGKKTVYEVDSLGTVASLKARIGRAMSVPMGFSRLSYKGRELSNQSLLEDLGPCKSALDLTWKPVVLTHKPGDKFDMLDYDRMDDSEIMFTLVGGYQQRQEHPGGIANPPDGVSQRNFNADDNDEPEAQDLTGLDLSSTETDDLPVNGKTELEPIAPLDLVDSLDVKMKDTKNDNEK
ncbi:GM21345 [Drosophila sechellia]|uniref:GM21345 n=1 Tax=Drosophila sechellia TaxID=7238 RepID=B4IJW2_DROSE|nr:GM21345 [Drosophila sechellia]